MRGMWSTIALVAVLAGLGGYIYFVESKDTTPGVTEREKVFTVESDKITEITLTSDGETSTLQKADGTWKMTMPAAADADQMEASSIANTLTSLEVNRVVDENASNLADYGLATPRIQIAFKGQDGVAGQVHLGDKNATQADVYAMKPGSQRVFLVQGYHETTFAKKPFDLRDKRILHFERDKVDTIEIASGTTPAIQLARAGSDWTLKQPVAVKGDYSAIEGVLTRLSSANMTKVVEPGPSDGSATPSAEALTKYGLDKPAVSVTLGAGSTRATIALGKEEDGAVYARDASRGMIFAVEPALLTDLKKGPDDYRDKELFKFRTFNVDQLRIVRGTEAIELKKVPGTGESPADKWQRTVGGGSPADVDTTKVDDLLTKLTSLRAQSFITELKGTGLETPALVVSASFDSGKFERVRLGKGSGAPHGSQDGVPGAAVLDQTAYDDMLKALDEAVTPPPSPLKP